MFVKTSAQDKDLTISESLLTFISRYCTAAEDIAIHGHDMINCADILDQLCQIRSLRRLYVAGSTTHPVRITKQALCKDLQVLHVRFPDSILDFAQLLQVKKNPNPDRN